MALILSVGFILCFWAVFLLGVVLVYDDATSASLGEAITVHDYFWARVLDIVIGIIQIGLSITGLVAISIGLTTNTELPWLNVIILCTLQFLAANNLARLTRIFSLPPWTIYLVYAITIVTIPDTASCTTDPILCLAYESALLSRTAIASLLSLVVSRRQLESFIGQRIGVAYKRMLKLFITTNALAGSFQIYGAISFYSLSLDRTGINTDLHHVIFLTCIVTQILNLIIFWIAAIRLRIIEPLMPRRQRPYFHRNADVEGAIRLNSFGHANVPSVGRSAL